MNYNDPIDALGFVTEAASHRSDQWRDRAKGRGVDTECFDQSSEKEAGDIANMLGDAVITGQEVIEVLRENPDILALLKAKLALKQSGKPKR